MDEAIYAILSAKLMVDASGLQAIEFAKFGCFVVSFLWNNRMYLFFVFASHP